MQNPNPWTVLQELSGLNLTKYPTKEEILEAPHTPSLNEQEAINRWKKTYYKNWTELSTRNKHNRIAVLIAELNIANRGKSFRYITHEYGWQYTPDDNTIAGTENKPSIVSALHELGHHLYGESELKACRYSVGIFRSCFSKDYEKLTWKGHTLVKNNAS
jgi:hypothetical protein